MEIHVPRTAQKLDKLHREIFPKTDLNPEGKGKKWGDQE